MTAAHAISGGLYLVVDPVDGSESALPKVEDALEGGLDVLQIWDHWSPSQDAVAFVEAMVGACHPRGVPVLVHENLDLLAASSADGIHFDTPTRTPAETEKAAARNVIYGLTCGNDLDRVLWAEREGADYVSFCSMFPSPSAAACELVQLDTITAARALCNLTLFASGGITARNASSVVAAGADGVAVISGVFSADDPRAAAAAYQEAIAAAAGRRSRR